MTRIAASDDSGGLPDLLLIGPATRDLLSQERWRLGGTVTYAALAASRLGQRPAIVTSGPEDLLAALREALPGVPIAAVPSTTATTFENVYTGGGRRQYLRGRAARLTLAAVPPAWRAAPLVLLAPLARDVDPPLASAFPDATVAATPQGWLRRWDTAGAVSPSSLEDAVDLLPNLSALILSREDLIPLPGQLPGSLPLGVPRDFAAVDRMIREWAETVPLVVVTQGASGAILLRQGCLPESFPGYSVTEVDPTGAGDVFAAAFLCELHRTGDARAATDFANRVAACSIERPGVAGIPTREEVGARFGV